MHSLLHSLKVSPFVKVSNNLKVFRCNFHASRVFCNSTNASKNLNPTPKLDRKPTSLFPILDGIDIESRNKSHKLTVKCSKVISLIKFGAINKHIAKQYCHYLIHLGKKCENQDDALFFRENAIDLGYYLLGQDISIKGISDICVDIASLGLDGLQSLRKRILDDENFCKSLPVGTFSSIIGQCYLHEQWDLAISLLEKRSSVEEQPIILEELENLSRGLELAAEAYKVSSLNDKEILRAKILKNLFCIFDICRQYNIGFALDQPLSFIETLESFDIEVTSRSPIKTNGLCSNCRQIVPTFNSDALPKLHQALEIILLEENDSSLLNTTPGEFQRFKTWLKMINTDDKPIDCVMDGLNIAGRSKDVFSLETLKLDENVTKSYKRMNPASSSQVLVNAIIRNNLTEKFKKILVIGREHMYSWPSLVSFFESSNIAFFFSKNSSKDDLFLLYAATINPKTIVISCDSFRDHVSKLRDLDQRLLSRWIESHQAWVNNTNLKIVFPNEAEKSPSVSEGKQIFHIPLINKLNSLQMTYTAPIHLNSKSMIWLCCKIKPLNKQDVSEPDQTT